MLKTGKAGRRIKTGKEYDLFTKEGKVNSYDYGKK